MRTHNYQTTRKKQYNKNNAKLKAINSVEAQNKFCEFLVSYWEDGIDGGIGK